MTLVMLLGGLADGRVLEFDGSVLVWPVERDAYFWKHSDHSPKRIDFETYHYQKIATPDRWTQIVFVHEGIDLKTVTESEMIRAIMTVWRARHRKHAESGLPHLPSGFTVTEEMLEDRPDFATLIREGRIRHA